MRHSILGAAVVLSAIAGSSAQAGCLYKPFEFHPEKNGGVVVTSIVEAGSSCAHNFAEGPGYHFDSVAIDRAPEHGALTQTSDTRFVFAPNPGFTGKDAYLFKICATKGERHGCSTIAFVATVRGRR